MKKTIVPLALLLLSSQAGGAAIHTESVAYRDGETALKGFLAYDPAVKGKRPAVIVVHEWWGLTDYPKRRAEQLAALGYLAFAADMYGGGRTTSDPKQAGEWATAARSDPALLKRRFDAALDVVRRQELADPTRIAAIGYCFGGTVCLEAARMGEDLKAVVAFHPGLDTGGPAGKDKITASILVCEGADDPMNPMSKVAAFVEEMRAAGADYQVSLFGGAVHAFSNPDADKYGVPGVKYNAAADRRSWAEMVEFLGERLK